MDLQLNDPSLVSREIQVWTQFLEQKNTDKIAKMREEIENKFESLLKETRTSESASTVPIPRSDTNDTQNTRCRDAKVTSLRSSRNNENSIPEEDDPPLEPPIRKN